MNQAILVRALWKESQEGNISKSGSKSGPGPASDSGTGSDSQSVSRSWSRTGPTSESCSKTYYWS